MYIYIVDIEYDSWESSMIQGVYETLDKAIESIKNNVVKLGGEINYKSENKLRYDVQVKTSYGRELVSFYIRRHEVK